MRAAVATQALAWRQLLSSRDFTWLWAGQVISQVGDGLAKVALLWFVYELTGSALKMTAVGLLQTVPPLVLGPLAGVYIDRVPKRAAMIVMDTMRAVLLIAIPLLYGAGLLNLTGLYVLVFVISVFSTAYGPALNAAIPLMVKQDQLTSANAFIQSSVTVGQLVGPAVSGILISLIGPQNVLYVNAVTFLVSALCKIPVRIQSTRAEGTHLSVRSMVRDLRQGFRFVFVQHRVLLLLMVVASLSFMGSTGFVYLLPVIGKQILHVDAVQLGWLWSSLGLGILLTTVWLAVQEEAHFCRQLWVIAGSALIGGIAVFGLDASPSISIAVVLVAAIGGNSGLVTPIISASLQQMTPKELLARVFGVFNTGTMASAMLGMTMFGWAADYISPHSSLIGIGATTFGAGVVTALLIPRCTRLLAKERA